jgi:hypothetical protein
MRGYFGLGQLSATEKSDILDQHKSLYNGYQTMQPQVSNTQPLYTYDFAGDKDGIVVNNKGEVKKYTNMGINEQVESKEMCEQCGGRMTEGICEQCAGTEMEEGVGKLDDIYDEEDLNPSAGFDYIEGSSNSTDTFEKMHHMKKIKSEGEYEDPDNEDDGFEDIQAGEEMDEDDTDGKPYEMGKRGMKASRARASFTPTPQENEILNNLFGQYGEDIPPIVIRYLRKLPRKTLLNRLVKVGLIDKDLLQGKETIDEQGYTGGGNAPDMDLSNIKSAYNFSSGGPMAGGDVYPTEGEMEEQSPEDNMRYRRRGIVYDNLLSFIDYEKTQWDMCHDFSDEFEYADNIISSAIENFFAETGQDPETDEFFDELHDICKDWFGEDLISGYYQECGGQEEEEEDEDFMFEEMKSSFEEDEMEESWASVARIAAPIAINYAIDSLNNEEEIEEVDVSGSQGIYGDMEPPYDFDSGGPGKAGPYQRSSYYEEDESEEEFDIDEDLQESFHNQKNKINEMMSRMKIIK